MSAKYGFYNITMLEYQLKNVWIQSMQREEMCTFKVSYSILLKRGERIKFRHYFDGLKICIYSSKIKLKSDNLELN